MVRAAILFALVSCAAAHAEPYAWPLDLPRVLTSSFGEYRASRYHMAIDLRTGPSPQPVRAAADGYVSRIRCSPYGYGKAVYVQLADGNTAVYAHLSDFAPALRDYVRRAQHERRAYVVDLYPEPNRFPVKQGEVIARSGQTGIGAPHLHYELRDPHGVPFNPRRIGIDWPDSKRPIFQRLLVVPLTPDSFINGEPRPLALAADPMQPGMFRTVPVEISGPVAFAVDVADYAESSTNRLGVHTLAARDANGEWFRVVHDRVSYETAGGGLVAYYPYPVAQGRFLMAYRWPGNASEIFAHSESDGAYTLNEPETLVTLEASDFRENASVLEVPLVRAVPRSEPPAPNVAALSGAGSVETAVHASWLAITVAFTAPEPETPHLEVQGLPGPAPVFRRLDDRRFFAGIEAPAQTTETTLAVRHPRIEPWSRRYHVITNAPLPGTQATEYVHLAGGSGFGPLWIAAEPSSVQPAQGLRLLGTPVALGPEGAPIAQPLEARFDLPGDAPPQAGLYRRTPRKWTWVSSRREGNALQANLSQLGEYAVMVDSTPPRLVVESPAPGQTLQTRRPAIRATVEDIASGIADWRVTANGKWLLFEYEPERNFIEWEADEDLPSGNVELVFTVTDEAGNTAERTLRFELPEA